MAVKMTRAQLEEKSALDRLLLHLAASGLIAMNKSMKKYIRRMQKVAREFRRLGCHAEYLYVVSATIKLLGQQHTHCIGYESIDEGDKFVFILDGVRYVVRKFVTRPKFVKESFKLLELEKSASTIACFHAELDEDQVNHQQYLGGKKWQFYTLSETSFIVEFAEDGSFSIDE